MWGGDSPHLHCSREHRADAFSNGGLSGSGQRKCTLKGKVSLLADRATHQWARNIMKRNIKLWWTAKPQRFKLWVNRDLLIYINTLHANSHPAWGLIWLEFLTVSHRRQGSEVRQVAVVFWVAAYKELSSDILHHCGGGSLPKLSSCDYGSSWASTPSFFFHFWGVVRDSSNSSDLSVSFFVLKAFSPRASTGYTGWAEEMLAGAH